MGCEKRKRKRENLEVSRKQQQHKIMKPLRSLKDKNYNGLPSEILKMRREWNISV